MKFDGIFKVTKIGIKDETKNRNVNKDDFQVGPVELIEVANGKKVLFCDGLFGYYLQTSPIVDIKDQENGNYLIETKNSIYTLEKVSDEQK